MKIIEDSIGVADDGEEYYVFIDENGGAWIWEQSISEGREIWKKKRQIEDKLSKKLGYEVYIKSF